MQVGILIIGSLLWDTKWCRNEWRTSRLAVDRAQRVRVGIAYRRRSRGDTFTMTFASDTPALGQAVLVPCDTDLAAGDGLVEEAKELWRAEQHAAPIGALGSSWGCVGALFGANSRGQELRESWTRQFRASVARSVAPVDQEGLLGIPWPTTTDGAGVDLDVILATATRPDPTIPPPEDVADAWCVHGHEEYFFENVRHGIRTPDDAHIWRRIEQARPRWLENDRYAEPVAILRRETSPGV
jgi:hypothetical protein